MQINKLSALHNELKTSYKEFFESKLAITLLKTPELFPAVANISSKIIDIIQSDEDSIKKLIEIDIQSGQKILAELYDKKYFGRLSKPRSINPDTVLASVRDALESKEPDLGQIMQLHCIFNYRIYPKLNSYKAAETSHTKSHFSDRGRIANNIQPLPTELLGIARNSVFSKMANNGETGMSHVRALGRFLPDPNSNYCETVQNNNVPYVAGPSGHTASLMSNALLHGLKSEEDLKQYALACFAFLTAGGNHSFNEVMISANHTAGVPFILDSYTISLPEKFKQSFIYEEFSNVFPEFLGELMNKPVFQLKKY